MYLYNMMSKRELQSRFVVGKIIDSLTSKPKTIHQLSEELDIKRSTLNYYLQTMEAKRIINRKRIEKNKTGRPTMISLTKTYKNKKKEESDKLSGYFCTILEGLNKKGGELPFQKYVELLPFNPNERDREKFMAPSTLLYVYPPLVEQVIKITPEGEQFLKENSK